LDDGVAQRVSKLFPRDVRDQPKLADTHPIHGRVGAEFDMEAGSKAARLVGLNALAVAKSLRAFPLGI